MPHSRASSIPARSPRVMLAGGRRASTRRCSRCKTVEALLPGRRGRQSSERSMFFANVSGIGSSMSAPVRVESTWRRRSPFIRVRRDGDPPGRKPRIGNVSYLWRPSCLRLLTNPWPAPASLPNCRRSCAPSRWPVQIRLPPFGLWPTTMKWTRRQPRLRPCAARPEPCWIFAVGQPMIQPWPPGFGAGMEG